MPETPKEMLAPKPIESPIITLSRAMFKVIAEHIPILIP
tara:strand:+ start:740 stop:856 length:117 start_codon:yes stop_codon:yes gene_type:complete